MGRWPSRRGGVDGRWVPYPLPPYPPLPPYAVGLPYDPAPPGCTPRAAPDWRIDSRLLLNLWALYTAFICARRCVTGTLPPDPVGDPALGEVGHPPPDVDGRRPAAPACGSFVGVWIHTRRCKRSEGRCGGGGNGSTDTSGMAQAGTGRQGTNTMGRAAGGLLAATRLQCYAAAL